MTDPDELIRNVNRFIRALQDIQRLPHFREDWIDNRNRFIRVHGQEYAGKQVVWSEDGTHILIAADTAAELFAEFARLGLSQDCLIDYIDPLELTPIPPVTESNIF